MTRTIKHSQDRGYTLIELMCTVTIVGVFASWGISSWSQWVADSRIRTLINDYHALFSYARWQAASTRQLVTVCPLSEALECVDNWNRPVHIFADNDKDGSPDDGNILRVMPEPRGWFKVQSRTAGTGYIRFSSTGMVHGRTGGMVLCHSQPGAERLVYLAVNKGGRFRSEHDRDGDNRIRLSSGTTVSCG